MKAHQIGRRQGFVGAGRAAQALAVGLSPSFGAPPLFYDIADRQAELAAAVVKGAESVHGLDHLATACDVIAIAVSDDAIASAVAALAAIKPLGSGYFVYHISGRCGAGVLDPLREAGVAVAAIHPVMTFIGEPAKEAARMVGAPFAVTAPDDPARERAQALVAALGGRSFTIEEEARALYHAALCHGANHLVTLVSGAAAMLRAAGVEQPADVLRPLVGAALDNTLASGFAALSGPLLRGDADTIASHLRALQTGASELKADYVSMAQATLRALEAGDQAPPGGTDRLFSLLAGRDP